MPKHKPTPKIKKMTNDEVATALEEIKADMDELLRKAERALRGSSEESCAKGYWWAHIRTALDKEHGYLGGSMTTMQDTIDTLREDEDEDEEDES